MDGGCPHISPVDEAGRAEHAPRIAQAAGDLAAGGMTAQSDLLLAGDELGIMQPAEPWAPAFLVAGA